MARFRAPVDALTIAAGMERLFWLLGGIYGFTAVALGAFGAHGLQARLGPLEDAFRRLEWWDTAAQYHLVHALALAFTGYLAGRGTGAPARWAGACFAAGVLLFSGSLYLMGLTGALWLGAITPFGGLLLLTGWAAIAVAALKLV